MSDKVTHAIQADATDEKTLRAIGIRNFDIAVVAIGQDIQSSILITLLCKESGLYVLAKAQNELHSKLLYKIGADKVVFPERDMGIRVAQSLVTTNILDYIQLTPDYRIVEMEAIEAWENKSLKELDIRARYGISVLAIKQGEQIDISAMKMLLKVRIYLWFWAEFRTSKNSGSQMQDLNENKKNINLEVVTSPSNSTIKYVKSLLSKVSKNMAVHY